MAEAWSGQEDGKSLLRNKCKLSAFRGPIYSCTGIPSTQEVVKASCVVEASAAEVPERAIGWSERTPVMISAVSLESIAFFEQLIIIAVSLEPMASFEQSMGTAHVAEWWS